MTLCDNSACHWLQHQVTSLKGAAAEGCCSPAGTAKAVQAGGVVSSSYYCAWQQRQTWHVHQQVIQQQKQREAATCRQTALNVNSAACQAAKLGWLAKTMAGGGSTAATVAVRAGRTWQGVLLWRMLRTS